MPDLFHNPYHFVPLPEKPGGPGRATLPTDTQSLPCEATHARFETNTFSGRIHCRLTTITPMVIGAKQTGEAPKRIHPFCVPGASEPGIPGSEVRGLISSIIEITTRSAFRVLDDRIFSYRKGMTEGLSALGLIVTSKDGIKLFPLADPHIESATRGQFKIRDALPKNSGDYTSMFHDELRKIYFGTLPGIREEEFLKTFSSNIRPTGGPFYALSRSVIAEKIKSRPIGLRTLYFDLGDMTDATPEAWDENSHNETDHIRGILRVLGVSSSGRKKGMPTKKHEFFIPLTKAEEQTLCDGTAAVFPILPEAVERFHQLADERVVEADRDTDPADILPYTPHGQTRAPSGGADKNRLKNAYHLKPGDIVFFRPTTDGQAVAEISLSSIWRGRVEKGAEKSRSAATLSDFIAKADPALLPMGDPRKTQLTPAELLIGFVETNGKRALAGRLAFSVAKPLPNQGNLLHQNWINLQVLNSPKPPSPNFYFRPRPGNGNPWISKSALALDKDQIQGRKVYLHTQDAFSAASPADPRWTMHVDNVNSGTYDRMRVQVRPVHAGKTFEFHIRFDNLSRFELGALIHALRPAKEFCHKIGMGKPLGLGTIRIDPVTVECVDRYNRYSKDLLDQPRIHTTWKRDLDSATWNGPSDVNNQKDNPALLTTDFLTELKKYDPQETTLRALLTLGDPSKVTQPVHYPQVTGRNPGTADFEADRYEWFVSNDGKEVPEVGRQHIGIIGGTIPTIKRLPKSERGGGGGGPRGGEGRPPDGGQRPRQGHHGQAAGGGWQGPVNCLCTGQGQRGDWKFKIDAAGPARFGFMDRHATVPPGLQQGARLKMHYIITAGGSYFFKPA